MSVIDLAFSTVFGHEYGTGEILGIFDEDIDGKKRELKFDITVLKIMDRGRISMATKDLVV